MQNFAEFLKENYGLTVRVFEEETDDYDKRIISLEWKSYVDHFIK